MAKARYDSAPDLPIALKFSTANRLLNVLLQQKEHATAAAAEGHPALLNEIQELSSLIEGLARYMDSYT